MVSTIIMPYLFIKKLLTLICGKHMYITSDIDDRLYYTGYIINGL